MTDLIAQSPAAGRLPITRPGVRLDEADLGRLTLIAERRGAGDALDTALETAHGLRRPGPLKSFGRVACRLIWFDHRHHMLIGPEPAPDLESHAHLTDVSDGWTCLTLAGPRARDTLARLVATDLRAASFPVGATLRTNLGHLPASLTRTDQTAFLILTFRSMARSAVHDFTRAMTDIANRHG